MSKNDKIARAIRGIKNGVFVPTMQPTYATADEVMEAHNGETFAEEKHDGYRVQVHKSARGTRIFTRNGNELNYQCYPDVMEIVASLPTCIIDAELVARGGSHKEVFDNVKKRFRRPGMKQETVEKYVKSGIIQDIPLDLMVFDTLKLGRENVARHALEERNSYTDMMGEYGLQTVDQILLQGTSELEDVIQHAFDMKKEGVICKDPTSVYMPGHKGIEWVKFKRSETLDLVVLGFYKFDPASELPYTSVLVGTYNDETGLYETLGKIGVTRDGMAQAVYDRTIENRTQFWPDNVVFTEEMHKKEGQCPHWLINPDDSIVLEVKAMNLNYGKNWQSCGLGVEEGTTAAKEKGKTYSMRIAYATQIRDDKGPRQATKTSDVAMLYRLQGVTQ